MMNIGICAHSYEGGALCFITACREGALLCGPHMHPNITVSAIPMGLSMPAWKAGDYDEIAIHLSRGVEQLANAGASFFICPDNTAHIVLEKIIDRLPIPGLHIAEVVCREIVASNWKKVALLGTEWTMTGDVYASCLQKYHLSRMIPAQSVRESIDSAIFDELCQGIFKPETTGLYIQAIEDLKRKGAECVILGCTEIPLIITSANSPLPVLDTTRLLAKHAVKLAVHGKKDSGTGWLLPQ